MVQSSSSFTSPSPHAPLSRPHNNDLNTNNNILNLRPSVAPEPRNEPYRLTFYVENDTRQQQHQQQHQQQPLQMPEFSDRAEYDDNDVVVESFESPVVDAAGGMRRMHPRHDSYCVLSAFLYFVTITTFAYLFVLWIRQKVHVQMELMHWW